MAGPHYTAPRLYDTTVPDLFTLIAHENPSRDVVQIIKEHPDASTDISRITWSTFLQHAQNAAADLRARWARSLQNKDAKTLAAEPRKSGTTPVVVGMLGQSGYEYYVNLLACTLNRWTVLPISPKNSPAAIEHLLRTSNSKLFLVDTSNLDFGRKLEKSFPGISTVPFAGFDVPESSPAPPLKPLTKEQVEIEMDVPAFYMHTSGSTGHPKIITWTHRFFLSGIRTRQRDGPQFNGLPFYSIPPLFHAMGMFAMVMFLAAHANLVTFISSPTPRPPSAASLLAYLPFIKEGIVSLPPSILEELYDLGPEAVQKVAEGTNHIIFAGAPLKKAIGDKLIAANLKMVGAYGSTEINPGTKMHLQKPEHWEYVEFREGYDWHFVPVDDHSKLRELIVVPKEDCPAVINHENPRGFATNDIWEPHPTISYLWKHHSRKGDVTVLNNGEKTDNKQVESLLLQDRRIRYAQVFGAGRPLNGVLLQPANPSDDPSEFLSLIQPTIDNANSILPRHSRLVPELIIITPAGKLFSTTDKGTIRREETLDLYLEEIKNGYLLLEVGGESKEHEFNGSVDNEQDVREFVRRMVKEMLEKEVPDAADLFESGLDSLLAIRLRAALLSVVKKSVSNSQPVARNIVYTYPTIDALTEFLLSRASPDSSSSRNSPRERILRSIVKFSLDFPVHKPGAARPRGSVVALTGSTGSVGTYILSLLLQKDDVSKIYLLNRKGSVPQKARQVAGFQERGLDPRILEEKKNITYLDVDLSRSDLGLSNEEYDDLRDNVTHIVHSAWHLNFNLILESYERVHIAGVRHLIDLTLSSPQSKPPRLIFLSSIAAAGSYKGPSQRTSQGEQAGQTIVPEEAIDDPSTPLNQGYGQGKYVAERVLVAASQAGAQVTIVRVGQLSGGTTNGAWSLTEHIPIMIRSSVALGTIPDDLPAVRWVPSDVSASAIVKFTFSCSSALEYYHVENPTPTPWKDIAQAVSCCLPRPLQLISLSAWLNHIASQDMDAEKVPAVRLLDFFQGVAQDMGNALGWQRSAQFAPEIAVGPIQAELVRKYVSYQLERSQNN